MNNPYKDFSDYHETDKICPLDGRKLTQGLDWSCFMYNCRHVSEDNWRLLYGHKCHCGLEIQNVQELHERQIERTKRYYKLNSSLERARSIDIVEFFDYCDNLYKEMTESRQYYSPNMIINPFHEPQDKCLICIFENDEVKEIGITENVFSYLGRQNDRITDPNLKTAISCIAVPGYMADAVSVNFNLRNGFDVKNILHADNPVYLKRRDVGKYVDAAYGWAWLDFQKVRDQYLTMMEIVNFDNIIYIKQELDEIVRRENK